MSAVAEGLDSRAAAPAEGNRLPASLDRLAVLVDEFERAANQIGAIAVRSDRSLGHKSAPSNKQEQSDDPKREEDRVNNGPTGDRDHQEDYSKYKPEHDSCFRSDDQALARVRAAFLAL